jgi:hypothetical protein
VQSQRGERAAQGLGHADARPLERDAEERHCRRQ